MIVETLPTTLTNVHPKLLKLTVFDLDAMPDDGGKYELIDGEIFSDGGTLVS